MLLAVHHRVMEHLGSLESTQEAKRYNACETSPKLSGENFGHLRKRQKVSVRT